LLALLLLAGARPAAAIDPEGGVGGGALEGTLTVTVIDAVSAQPISGAYCQVGPAPGVPFANNLVLTNASGVATFTSGTLYGPQTVTVGKSGYNALTIFDVNAAQMILPIRLKDFEPVKALYSGDLSGMTIVNTDDSLDISIVLPSLSIDDLTSLSNFGQFAPVVVEPFPLIGDQQLPGNVYMPPQLIIFPITIDRTPYYLWLPDQTTQDLFTFYGRIATSTLLDLLGSPDPDFLPIIQSFNLRRYGIVEGVGVNGPAVRNIALANNAAKNLRVRVANTMPGTSVFVFGVADLDQLSGLGRLVPTGFNGIAGGGAPSVLTVATIVAGGVFNGQNYLAGALQSDTAAVALANSFVVDRRGLAPGDTAVATSFMRPPELIAGGEFLSWSLLENPGVSPAPDLHFASLDLVKVIPDTNPGAQPGDTLEIPTTLWEFILPSRANSFEVPQLGALAPPPIVDPGTTTDDDRLDWRLAGAALELDPAFNYSSWDLVDRAREGTHLAWNALRNVPYLYTPPTDVALGDADIGRGVRDSILQEPTPNPFVDVTSIGFVLSPEIGRARLEVFDVAGRRIRTVLDVPAGVEQGRAYWDGLNDFGEPVPPGSYFFRIEAGRNIDSKKIVKAR
jgi:hypothetical protein